MEEESKKNKRDSPLDAYSAEEIRAYLEAREKLESRESSESREGSAGRDKSEVGEEGVPPEFRTASEEERSEFSDARFDPEPFSLRETLDGKTIFVIGGTGFLGRMLLYFILRHAPGVRRLFLLIRPTHGRTGQDRLEAEILNSPVFTSESEDREYFARLARKKITVLEGDASRPGLALSEKDAKLAREKADVVLNTAGNVEFNPPLDMSLNANAVCTREVLDFVETCKSRRYLHVSTCYVADRSRYSDFAPESPVSSRVVGEGGNEIIIDPEKEIAECRETIERLRASFETPERVEKSRVRALEELRAAGRADASERLRNKIAKNIRTLELREELIRAGRERAARLNRPNVYTYTKTLAELLVRSRRDTIDAVILRPSIVETTIRRPFPGWNEGIQGSAPLIFLYFKGHRFFPSISRGEEGRQDAVLDLIPADFVAAGTLLALAALFRGEKRRIYQAAAGKIDNPVSITRIMEIIKHALRDPIKEEYRGLKKWALLNILSRTVTQESFERFSSPRTMKLLSKARRGLEKIEGRTPPAGAELVGRARKKVDRYYNLSLMKNKIFSEFMPFINQGFPFFRNDNLRALWNALPEDEKEVFYFAPENIDYTDYIAGVHLDALRRWIFPVLEKRINSIFRDRSSSEREPLTLSMESLRAVFTAGGAGFRAQYRALREGALPRFGKFLFDGESSGSPVKENAAKGGASWKTPASASSASFAGADSKARVKYSLAENISRFLEGRSIRSFAEESDEILTKTADHVELITGVPLNSKLLRRLKDPAALEEYIKKEEKRKASALGGGEFAGMPLPREGLDIPGPAREPIRDFCYALQMRFYKRTLNVKVEGRENIPLNHNDLIVIANHCSHLDYGLVWYGLGDYAREMGILAARDYFFSNFWNSTFFRNFHNLIPLERSEKGGGYEQALRPALDFMKRGGPLLIFPEGTRSPDGNIQPFRQGLGYLAAKTEADILPVRISGSFEALPRGARFLRGRDIRLKIGAPVSYEELRLLTEGFSPTKTYFTINQRLQEVLTSLD